MKTIVGELRGSTAFVQTLSATLCVGNYLNGASRQGSAWGFKLTIMTELNGTKSLDDRLDDLVARVQPADISYQLTARQSTPLDYLGLPSYYW